MTSYTLDKTVRKKVGGILLNNYLNKLPGLRFVHTQKNISRRTDYTSTHASC